MVGKQKKPLNNKLIARIYEYVEQTEPDQINIEDAETYLRKEYGEYSRQKHNRQFRTAVARAMEWVVTNSDSVPVEKAKNLSKTKSKSRASAPSDPVLIEISDEGKNSDSSFSSNNNNYVSYSDTNMMNSNLTAMYADSPDGAPSSQNRKKRKREIDRNSETKMNNESQLDHFVFSHSSVTFADIGGCEVQLTEVCKLLMHLKHPEIYWRIGVTPPGGFLLHGPPGCGKTLLAQAVAGELNLPFIRMAATELVSGVSGESEEKIRNIFAKAKENAPCILFLDEIDSITPKRETAQREMERRIVAQLLSCLDELNSINTDEEEKKNHVLVIGATNRPDSLEPALRRAGRFDKEIALGIPDEKARQRILEVACRKLRTEESLSFKKLARMTPGFVGADLTSLAREASMCAINRVFDSIAQTSTNDFVPPLKNEADKNLEKVLKWLKAEEILSREALDDLYVTEADFLTALKLGIILKLRDSFRKVDRQTFHPSAKREGFATVPDVCWEDVGALSAVREELKWSILFPVKCPEEFDSMGLGSRPQGVLLCGPPGCGKTLLAKAVANETGMNFISVKGPELLNMYVGESEKAVRQVFQRARNSVPCVIFFDELDALCPRRCETEVRQAIMSGGSVRVVNQLLTEMDGVEERKQVFIIGATNRPDIIDPAILRPGRLDKVVFVGFPSAQDRVEILKALTKNGTKPKIQGVSFEQVVEDSRCKFFSGADLAALVREASVAALREYLAEKYPQGIPELRETKMEEGTTPVDTMSCVVEQKHFEKAFQCVKPSVSVFERERYRILEQKYGFL